MDFSKYGDASPEWNEYIQSHTILPTGLSAGQSVTDLRDTTNRGREAVAAAFMKSSGLDQKVSWTDHRVPVRDGMTIGARIYRPKTTVRQPLPAYIFFHGGGFLFGTLSSEDAGCARIVDALQGDVCVVNVCYRHTPDDRYPTQHHDAWDALEWVAAHSDELAIDPRALVVGGISAGGGLACSVALQASSSSSANINLRGQVLCIPWLIHRDAYPFEVFASRDKASYEQCRGAPVLPLSQLDMFTDELGCDSPRDPSMSVGLVPDDRVRRLPKTAMIVAGMDPLRDDGLLMAARLRDQGVPTKVHVFPGLPHGFRRFEDLPSSRRWDQLVNEGIRWVLDDSVSSTDEKGQEGMMKIETPPYD